MEDILDVIDEALVEVTCDCEDDLKTALEQWPTFCARLKERAEKLLKDLESKDNKDYQD